MASFQKLEQFRSHFSSKPVEIELPEFARDGASFSVYLKPLTSKDRDNFEASVVGVDGERDLSNLRARLVSKSLCTKDGELIATEDELGELSAEFIGALFDKVRELNGMTDDDEAGKD